LKSKTGERARHEFWKARGARSAPFCGDFAVCGGRSLGAGGGERSDCRSETPCRPRGPAAAAVNLVRRNRGPILATFNLEAATHVKFTIWTAYRLLFLPTEMKILVLRIANRPAALIEQKRLKGPSLGQRHDRIIVAR
jgi:hypothetical protein